MTSSVTSAARSRTSSNLSLLMDEYNNTLDPGSSLSKGSSSRHDRNPPHTISSHTTSSSSRHTLVTRISLLSIDDDDDNTSTESNGSYFSYMETNPTRFQWRITSSSSPQKEQQRARTTPNESHRLGVSPLTASSYQTLNRLYELDTQRMHDRILGARKSEVIQRQPTTRQAMEHHEYDVVQDDWDDNQSELVEIFDLDMD